MSSFTHATTLLHAHIKTKHKNTSNNNINNNPLLLSSSPSSSKTNETTRRNLISTFLATSIVGVNVATTPIALAQNWGTRSFLKEHFFEPGLSPEDAVLRIKQTAEGLHNLREMLEHLSWRYVMFYIRLKQNYLEQDLKNAITTLPENRRKEYVKTANQLVDNLTEMDRYVRSPKVYESYLYYEKTLKSIDELVALLA
ncbi:photosynthetic NDH subunit of lumenal location 3, chloroplastic [Trifolium repens]|nr:photosynthetic NDH subunit of lumenal location 3, chloroplastic [Trifolium repens]